MFNSKPIKFPTLLSSIFKSATTGRVLASQLLRFVVSIPGQLIDQILGVMIPDYLNLNQVYLWNFDGKRLHLMTAAFGFLGDVIGRVLGLIIGLTLGIALYIPDALIVTTINLFRQFYNGLFSLEKIIKEESSLKDLFWGLNDQNNIRSTFAYLGALTIGLPLAIVPFAVSKLVEFFIPPLKGVASRFFLSTGGVLGGVIGQSLALPIVPVLYLIGKVSDLYEGFRHKVRDGVALVYAKTNMWVLGEKTDSHHSVTVHTEYPEDRFSYYPPFAELDADFIAAEIHSQEFLSDVELLRHTTWSKLIFGVFANDDAADNLQVSQRMTEDHVPSAPIYAEVTRATKSTVDNSISVPHAQRVL